MTDNYKIICVLLACWIAISLVLHFGDAIDGKPVKECVR